MSDPYYCSSDELRIALGTATFLAIFDENNDGTADAEAVTLVQVRAHARVVSRLVDVFGANIPASLSTTAPILLKDAELDYATALAWQRHPEYVRAHGKNEAIAAMERADQTMARVQSAIARLSDFATKPANVGGVVNDTSSRLVIDSADGTKNSGDF